MLKQILHLLKNEILFEIYRFFKKEAYEKNIDCNIEIVKIAKLIKDNGFAVIDNFYNEYECKNLRNEIDFLIIDREEKAFLWADASGSDKRIFCAEDDSELVRTFFNNSFIINVASAYGNMKMECSNTLAARIEYKSGNLGSGEGWHRDSNNFQFKALLYLDDVEEKDGPFQILKGSHRFITKIIDTVFINKEDISARFNNKDMEVLLKRYPSKFKTFAAQKGTLILVDTSCIHSGKPLGKGGKRYALTNYYYPSYDDIEKRKRSFDTSNNPDD